MTDITPLPCPFCGSQLRAFGSREYYHDGDQQCVLYGQILPAGRIEDWNRRAQSDPTALPYQPERTPMPSDMNGNIVDAYHEYLRAISPYLPGGQPSAEDRKYALRAIARDHGVSPDDLHRWVDHADATYHDRS